MPEDRTGTEKDAALKALRAATKGQRVLVVLDDIWQAESGGFCLHPSDGPRHCTVMTETLCRSIVDACFSGLVRYGVAA